MNTPSHAIINLALLTKPQLPQANLAIVIGGILPDIPIFIFYFWAKFIARLPETKIWSEAYYQPLIQNFVAIFHSIPLAIIGLLISYYFDWQIMQVICISLVLHSLLDLPVHNDDAHRHFFPFTNYRFISPISYWDPKHYGSIVALIEILLVLLATLRVFPGINSVVGKGLMILVNIFYWSGYIYFYLRSRVLIN
ncbi:MAG: hypothetical protein F6K22_36365 [Okeania sp. SIO2F4]|uniref:hypothetical protein n=1 Tax=Okeania sp. SIO2F4 TaxID=2607790 RepID=UPI00142D1662|nr:hypothetical protein [Okeania sp. SIO2F4]NES07787.1 hypothetical protein [Okeania sp. SIO2F4]